MASPLSLSDIVQIVQLGYDIIKGCKDAPDQFKRVIRAIRSVEVPLEAIKRASKNKGSVLHTNKGVRKDVLRLLRPCYETLQEINEIRKKYDGKAMGVMGGINALKGGFKWWWGDGDEVKELLADLESLTDQLKDYIGLFGGIKPEDLETDSDIEEDAEVTVTKKLTARGVQVDPEEKKNLVEYRKASCQQSKQWKANKPPNKASRKLELYVVTLSASALSPGKITFEQQDKKQWKLREIVEEFKASAKKQLSKGAQDHRVKSLLEQKAKKEEDKKFEWVYIAGRVESRSMGGLGLVAIEVAMVVISRQMTPKAFAEYQKANAPKPQPPKVSLPIVKTPSGPKNDNKNPKKSPSPHRSPSPKPPAKKDDKDKLKKPSPAPTPKKDRSPSPKPPSTNKDDKGKLGKPSPSLAPNKGPSPKPTPSPKTDDKKPPKNPPAPQSKCKQGARCKNPGCKFVHPAMCKYDSKCHSLKCTYKHTPLGECRYGNVCASKPCNYDHKEWQCSHDPCTKASCFLKHRAGQQAV